MKTSLLSLAIVIAASPLFGQQNHLGSWQYEQDYNRQNELKINLFAISFKSICLEYERQISRKTTISFDLRAMPESSLPFKNVFEKNIHDTSTARQLDNFKTGNVAWIPSIRFYLGHGGAFHGFYIAPFLEYAHYTASLPFKYDDGEYKIIPLSGTVNTFTGGFMLGALWNLSPWLDIDWWILGLHYGISQGSINGKKSLTPSEQEALKSELDNLDIPLTKTTNKVDVNGATIDFSGPWAGIRSGLCLGIKF